MLNAFPHKSKTIFPPALNMSTPSQDTQKTNAQQSQALFIDVETRKRLHQTVGEDLSYLLVGSSAQAPSYTLHHIQKHVKSRCPAVIENGKHIYTTQKTTVSELKEDTDFTLQQLEGMRLAADGFKNTNIMLKQRLEALR